MGLNVGAAIGNRIPDGDPVARQIAGGFNRLRERRTLTTASPESQSHRRERRADPAFRAPEGYPERELDGAVRVSQLPVCSICLLPYSTTFRVQMASVGRG